MKRWYLGLGLVLTVLGASFVIARAATFRRHCWHHHGPLAYMSHELHLTSAQRSQVQSIWQTERPTVAKLVQEFAAESKEMSAATPQGSFDQEKVRSVADRQGATVAALLVEKQKIVSLVYAILTPEQRTRADQLQDRWHDHFDEVAQRLADQGDHSR